MHTKNLNVHNLTVIIIMNKIFSLLLTKQCFTLKLMSKKRSSIVTKKSGKYCLRQINEIYNN